MTLLTPNGASSYRSSPTATTHGGAGHPWNDHRPLVNGILWHLHTGSGVGAGIENYGTLTVSGSLLSGNVRRPWAAAASATNAPAR